MAASFLILPSCDITFYQNFVCHSKNVDEKKRFPVESIYTQTQTKTCIYKISVSFMDSD